MLAQRVGIRRISHGPTRLVGNTATSHPGATVHHQDLDVPLYYCLHASRSLLSNRVSHSWNSRSATRCNPRASRNTPKTTGRVYNARLGGCAPCSDHLLVVTGAVLLAPRPHFPGGFESTDASKNGGKPAKLQPEKRQTNETTGPSPTARNVYPGPVWALLSPQQEWLATRRFLLLDTWHP